ncbi:hypothetical protein VULLAG_LOCUS15957 [Vulpes lagopus]
MERTATKQCSGNPRQLRSKCQRQPGPESLKGTKLQDFVLHLSRPHFPPSTPRNLATANCSSPPSTSIPRSAPPSPRGQKAAKKVALPAALLSGAALWLNSEQHRGTCKSAAQLQGERFDQVSTLRKSDHAHRKSTEPEEPEDVRGVCELHAWGQGFVIHTVGNYGSVGRGAKVQACGKAGGNQRWRLDQN